MAKPVAFFDIDGTFFRSSLIIEFVERCIEKEVFTPEVRSEYQREHEAWRNREGSYKEYVDAVVRAFMQYVKGVHYGTVVDVGEEVTDEYGKRVYRYTRDLIASLRSDGYYLVAISHSPKFLLDNFGEQYGFDKMYGSLYEIGPQDLFTGALADEHIWSNKANIVKRVFENQDVQQEGSVGVGDTESDISLLELVGQPICFNPNQKLYNHAKLMDWKVVVERKDVIYEL